MESLFAAKGVQQTNEPRTAYGYQSLLSTRREASENEQQFIDSDSVDGFNYGSWSVTLLLKTRPVKLHNPPHKSCHSTSELSHGTYSVTGGLSISRLGSALSATSLVDRDVCKGKHQRCLPRHSSPRLGAAHTSQTHYTSEMAHGIPRETRFSCQTLWGLTSLPCDTMVPTFQAITVSMRLTD